MIINQAYKRDLNRCCGPVYFAGETYSFYINGTQRTSDPNFPDFRLDLLPADSLVPVQMNIGPLSQDVDAMGFYNIYGSFEFPTLTFGWYRFGIWDAVDGVYKATSNLIWTDDEATTVNTAIISYRHSSNLYGINFEGLPDLWLRVRLPLIQVGWQPETERKQYRNVTNRRLRNLRNYRDETYKIEGYKLDEKMHRALATIFDHDQVFLNDSFVVPKNVYAVQENEFSVLNNGQIDVVFDDTVALPDSLVDLARTFDPADWSDEFE